MEQNLYEAQVAAMMDDIRKGAPLVGALKLGPERSRNKPIGQNEIKQAAEALKKYKQGKANLEQRIVEDELWWEGRHWEVIRKGKKDAAAPAPEPTSAWLFNSILNKHADAMDNYPEPVVLPREKSDEGSARTLSSVLPVVMEYNEFEQVYNDNWWEKLKHGTSVYGVFWDSQKENGLGDIDIQEIDLLKLFWEPGITDIQKSRNLFLVELVDEEILDQQYPQHAGKMGGNAIEVKDYLYDDTVDNTGKSVVVDWYYKKARPGGGSVLHYAKFVGDVLLFASENEVDEQGAPAYPNGWYDHGDYPVVLDVLFPEKGTPVGFGYVAICRDPQLYIDKLSGHIMENAMMASKKRFFISENTAVNEEEFLDWNKPLVHVASGDLDDRRIREIVTQPLSSIYLEIMNMKIEEMKDTAANRDVNSGSTGSGVTAAAAIAALQEAGNKTSRDMISASYRAQMKVSSKCIELMRQFYDVTRSFRVTGPNGDYTFVDMNNAAIREQEMGFDSEGQMLYRKPVFDLKIKAQKKNPFSRMEQNERAKELYGMGFFNPERAQEAMCALEMMDFEGIDKVKEQVRQGQTLLNMVQQLNMLIQQLTGAAMMPGGQAAEQGAADPTGGETLQRKAVDAQKANMTSYGQRLAARSGPNMNAGSNSAMPGA